MAEDMLPGDLEQRLWLSGVSRRLLDSIDEGDFLEQRDLLEKVYNRFGAPGLYLMARVIARKCAELCGLRAEMKRIGGDEPDEVFVGMRVYDLADNVVNPEELGGVNASLVLAARFLVAHANEDSANLTALFLSDEEELHTNLLSGLVYLASLYKTGWPHKPIEVTRGYT